MSTMKFIVKYICTKGWIRVTNPILENKNVSWCKVEVTVNDSKNINTFADNDTSNPKTPPPFVALSLNIKTVMSDKHANEIVSVSALVFSDSKI